MINYQKKLVDFILLNFNVNIPFTRCIFSGRTLTGPDGLEEISNQVKYYAVNNLQHYCYLKCQGRDHVIPTMAGGGGEWWTPTTAGMAFSTPDTVE